MAKDPLGSEEFMDETGNASSQTGFVRQSETESICTGCSRSIKTERSAFLELAEDIHADVCLARPDSHLGFILL
jgi:hypothetical protein